MAQSDSSTLTTLPALDDIRPPTVTDQVYEALYERVVDLTLPPGAKLSEAEVAAQMGVSRQPVRDAFYRLSQLGFIQIRPQRATVVTPISEEAIRQAKFIRLSLELSCIREAVQRLTDAQLDALAVLLDRQQAAADADRRSEFHALDDQFHHDIASHSGLGFVWAVVKDKKGHMDRARYLSLGYNAGTALAEHRVILQALRARDSAAALAAMTAHLSRIDQLLARLRSERPEVLGA